MQYKSYNKLRGQYRIFIANFKNPDNWTEIFLPKIPYEIMLTKNFKDQSYLFKDEQYKHYWLWTFRWFIIMKYRLIKKIVATETIMTKVIVSILGTLIGGILLYYFIEYLIKK